MNDIYEQRRKQLQQALIDAALALADHTMAQAFKIPVPNTDPPLFVQLGEMK